jgi:hypothetical protein
MWDEMQAEAVGRMTRARLKESAERGRQGDGFDLCLLTSNADSKSWVDRIRRNGKRITAPNLIQRHFPSEHSPIQEKGRAG